MTETAPTADAPRMQSPLTLASAWESIKGYTLKVTLICLVGWMLTNMDQSLFAYAIPAIMREFDIGIDVIGLVLTVCFIASGLSNVALGLVADRYGRKLTFVFCLSVSAALVASQSLVGGILVLTILRAAGFSLSNAIGPITNTYVVEAAPARLRGVMMGLLQTGYPLGWALAALLAVPLLAEFGWRAVFLPALAVIPLAFLFLKLLPESQRFEAAKASPATVHIPWQKRLAILFTPELRKRTIVCFISFFCIGGAYAGTAFYFPTFFAQMRGYSEEAAAGLVGMSYFIGLAGYIMGALVGEFVTTRRNTFVIWTAIGTVALIGLIWLPTERWHDVFWLSLMTMFFYGANAVNATYVTEVFPTQARATGVAFAAAFPLNLGFAVFPILVANLVEAYGWQWAFTVGTAPFLLLSGLVLLLLENLKSGTEIDDKVEEVSSPA